MKRFPHLAGCVLVASLIVSGTACSASYGYDRRAPGRDYVVELDRRAYSNGYEEGVEGGRRDARRGRSFNYRRHDEFRDGDHGYSRRFGDRERYRDSFRRGFVAGYNAAYRSAR
jgi:hypothetical protein